MFPPDHPSRPIMSPRILEVRTRILKKNDEIARALRDRFAECGVYAVNVVSSPGAGKTELLARLLGDLKSDLRLAAVVGDLKVWGRERDTLIDAARRIAPEDAAALYQRAIDADLRTKTGYGQASRTLEALAVEIADTMNRA